MSRHMTSLDVVLLSGWDGKIGAVFKNNGQEHIQKGNAIWDYNIEN